MAVKISHFTMYRNLPSPCTGEDGDFTRFPLYRALRLSEVMPEAILKVILDFLKAAVLYRLL